MSALARFSDVSAQMIATLAVAAVALLTVQSLPKVRGLSRLRPALVEGRLMGLDGLRGFLALGVLLSHASSYRHYFVSGVWIEPSERAFEIAGQFAVSLFFGITGFLFWDRSLAGKINARTLYPRRFMRIYPLYAALLAVTVLFALLRQPLVESPKEIVGAALRMIVPGFGTEGAINGFRPLFAIGQAWTLRYEIAFYLALPLLSPVARLRGSTYALFALAFAASYALRDRSMPPSLLLLFRTAVPFFASGMLVAALSRIESLTNLLKGNVGSALVAATIVGRFALLPRGFPLSASLAMIVVLLPLVSGADLFGLLSLRVCRQLGEISYSLYMVHNLVLYVFLSSLTGLLAPTIPSAPTFWFVVVLATLATVAISLVSFHYLEKPFLGRKPLPAADAAP